MKVSDLAESRELNKPADPNLVAWVHSQLKPIEVVVPDQLALMYDGDLVGLLREMEIDEGMLDYALYLNDLANPSAYTTDITSLLVYDKEELARVLSKR